MAFDNNMTFHNYLPSISMLFIVTAEI